MPLFHFHNEFDDVDVQLEDVSGEGDGPFVVTLKYNDPMIAPAELDCREEFEELHDAHLRFQYLVCQECECVLENI